MPSTRERGGTRARRSRRYQLQSGQSLVEALVDSAWEPKWFPRGPLPNSARRSANAWITRLIRPGQAGPTRDVRTNLSGGAPDVARSRRHRLQSGQSLVEALVASALVAIAVMAGIGTLDASVRGARQVAVQAWAQCMQRGVVEAVTAAPWSSTYPAPAAVSVQVSSVPAVSGAQRITVSVSSPRTGGSIAAVPPVTVFKAQVLSPAGATYDPSLITSGCQPLLGGSA